MFHQKTSPSLRLAALTPPPPHKAVPSRLRRLDAAAWSPSLGPGKRSSASNPPAECHGGKKGGGHGGWVVGEIHRNLKENIKTGRITALEMVAMLGVDVCLWENYHQNLLSESVVWIFEQTVSRCKCNTPTVLHMIRNFSTWGSLNQLLGHPANLSHSFPSQISHGSLEIKGFSSIMTIFIEEVFNLSHLQLRLVSLWVNHAAHPLVSIKTLRRVELGTLWDLAHTWMGFCWQSWHMFRISLQINLIFNVIIWYYMILYDIIWYYIILYYMILYDISASHTSQFAVGKWHPNPLSGTNCAKKRLR